MHVVFTHNVCHSLQSSFKRLQNTVPTVKGHCAQQKQIHSQQFSWQYLNVGHNQCDATQQLVKSCGEVLSSVFLASLSNFPNLGNFLKEKWQTRRGSDKQKEHYTSNLKTYLLTKSSCKNLTASPASKERKAILIQLDEASKKHFHQFNVSSYLQFKQS